MRRLSGSALIGSIGEGTSNLGADDLFRVSLAIPGEAVYRLAAVGLTGTGDGLRPAGMVETVGVELGLQRHAGALAVVYAALAGLVKEIACVKLNARAVGADAHAPAGDRVRQGGAGIAEDLPVVVVAALKLQRLVVRADVLPDGLGRADLEESRYLITGRHIL